LVFFVRNFDFISFALSYHALLPFDIFFSNFYIHVNICIQNRVQIINPLNTELNPICHMLALLGARHILHFSRVRVKIFHTFKDKIIKF
jgi:hypothetical protein